MRRSALLILAALPLAACTSQVAPAGAPAPAVQTTAAAAAAAVAHPALVAARKAGCADPVKVTPTPLLAQEAVDCRSMPSAAGKYVAFLAFGNNEGRDAWLQTAASFGDVGVIKADRLVVEIPDQEAGLDALAAKLAQATGGQRVS